MKRGPTGTYEVTAAGGEPVRAFVPASLPPDPPLAIDGPLQARLEKALLALGRLDSISSLLPDTSLFLYSYVRKEAVLSSQIEGTQSTLSDLLLFELKETPGVPFDDVREVSNYVAALEHGLARIRDGFPMTGRLLREVHGILLESGRGSERDPGEFRRTQNWLGGTRPGNAVFVPPPPTRVPDAMSALERFLHTESDPRPSAVVQAALAHVQFETIHPFLDGNGRVGRLLVPLILCRADVLREPLLYLSLFLKEHRDGYYRLLNVVREEGDWEAWLSFFLEGIAVTADGAVTSARRLTDLFEEDRRRIRERGRAAGSALRVHEVMQQRPITRLPDVARRSGLSFPAASAGMKLLEDLRVVREVSGRKRSRIYAYDRHVAILGEGSSG